MILNKGEALIWETKEEGRECVDALRSAGYRFFYDGDIAETDRNYARGFRWSMRYEFPNCVSIIDDEVLDWMLADGIIHDISYGDNGECYSVRMWNAPSLPSMEDLL